MHRRFPQQLELAMPIIDLIYRSIFRPRSPTAAGSSGSVETSLGIRPLHELVDMYRAHEATEMHDKVFALLGMCSDNLAIASSGLSPDYTVPWVDLVTRLVEYCLGNGVSVSMLGHGERVMIKCQGYVLGTVLDAKPEDTINMGQSALIAWRRSFEDSWELFPAMTTRLRVGDLVCYISGAPRPTIIRPHSEGAYFSLVTTAMKKDNPSVLNALNLSRQTGFCHRFSLVWDFQENPQSEPNGCKYRATLMTPEETMEHFSVALVLEDLGVFEASSSMFQEIAKNLDIGPCQARRRKTALQLIVQFAKAQQVIVSTKMRLLVAVAHLRERMADVVDVTSVTDPFDLKRIRDAKIALLRAAVRISQDTRGSLHLSTLRVREKLAIVSSDGRMDHYESWFRLVEDRIEKQGVCHQEVFSCFSRARKYPLYLIHSRSMGGPSRSWWWIEAIKMVLGRKPITEEGLVAIARSQTGNLMRVFLKYRGEASRITNSVVEAAARNEDFGNGVMEVLLNQRGNEIRVTTELVEVAAGNNHSGADILSLLVQRGGGVIPVTEKALLAAMLSFKYWWQKTGEDTLKVLVGQLRDSDALISEAVLAEAAKRGEAIFNLLLDRKPPGFQASGRLLWAAASPTAYKPEPFRILLERSMGEIRITQDIVLAAAISSWAHHSGGLECSKMAVLLGRKGAKVRITSSVIQRMIKSKNWELLKFILERRGKGAVITKKLMVRMKKAICREPKR